MYWIYLSIFVAVVFMPMLVQGGLFFLAEDTVEALIIFCLGALGFLIYLAKDKALIRLIREKILLQKQTNIITRDLSDSYSYIGELNRKFDIVKNLAFHLPRALSEGARKKIRFLFFPLGSRLSARQSGSGIALFREYRAKKDPGSY